MIYAISRGVPEAGIAFALAMLIGITFTLAAVAVGTTLARDRLAHVLERHGRSVARISQGLDAVAGLLLIALGVGRFAWPG